MKVKQYMEQIELLYSLASQQRLRNIFDYQVFTSEDQWPSI